MPKKHAKPNTPNTLESSIQQLEFVIAKLEGQEQSLDEALAGFEEGVKLLRDSQALISAAEQRVSVLLERDGQIKSTDLAEIENNSD